MASAEEALPRVALELFGQEDIEGGLGGCYFAIWQHNRDPEKDRFAYAFHTDFGENVAPNPARIEIAGTVHRVAELVSGGPIKGGLATQHLYANGDRSIRVHIEVLDAGYANALTTLHDVSMTVIERGKVPFVLSGKGVHGCPKAAGTAGKRQAPEVAAADQAPLKRRIEPRPAPSGLGSMPAGLAFGPPVDLVERGDVPAALQRAAREWAGSECDFDLPAAWPGTRYSVNDFYVLWQLPCFSGAYQASSVFGVTQNPPGDWADILLLPDPATPTGSLYGAMNAKVDPRTGRLETTALARGLGDCGTYAAYRLVDGPGEVLEWDLLEYRAKPECDGQVIAPEHWPLVQRTY
ncbi:hypothetical protein GCM10011316_36220 [Roseibium aquae]|uniref:DUF1176 domain-containing protein n=2 Tax=Roseibium aquae TaxID=1323746 RepID=A0A916TNJ7_9HYPH|nr:hypothetical protein GCM10011316_36220 [Roseibium aquae]